VEKDFLLPDVGEGLEEATIVEWKVAVGDLVAINQPVCVIETAKAEVELSSPFEGTVTTRHGEVGEELRVGELLVRFDIPTETPPTGNPVLVGYGVRGPHSPVRRKRDWTPLPKGSGGSRPWLGIIPPDVASSPAKTGRPRAKPPVRKLASELGVDLSLVMPTGSRGEVTREDVHKAATQTLSTGSDYVPAAASDEVIPVVGVRARIASQMSLSRSTIPEATCGLDVDCSELLRVRDVIRAELDAHQSGMVTPFALVSWMVPKALRRSPLLNASFEADAQVIRVRRAVHLGLATATERGLLVPVIKNAHEASLLEFAAQLARLADSARQGTLSLAELSGSTFTITNYGALGLDDGNPVINYPESAILGVGAIRERPAVVAGRIMARPQTKLVCAFDHRVCDGADAALFLTALKRLVEEPMTCVLDC
jgi:pyruvate dehydrogenase E2 component (dihydrolipoamide acetyltransferase)